MNNLLIGDKRVFVDDEDFDKVSIVKWHLLKSKSDKYYAIGRLIKGQKKVLMHRFVLGLLNWDRNKEVDHIDRNSLNNCKSNLRIITHRENLLNVGYSKNNKLKTKGIHIQNGKYRAYATINGHSKHIGMYESLEEAIEKRAVFVKEVNK